MVCLVNFSEKRPRFVMKMLWFKGGDYLVQKCKKKVCKCKLQWQRYRRTRGPTIAESIFESIFLTIAKIR